MPDGPKGGERRFRLLADHAPVMIWRADPTKACDFFNKPWLEFTGRELAQELGSGWAEGVHPQDLDRCLEIYTRAFDAREEFSMSYRLRRHDGEYRWLLDNGRPYYAHDGAFAGYFGSCIDITDMKRALDDKDVLLGELQHRVRNNMQLIVSLIQLQSETAVSPEAKSKLQETAGRVKSIALAQDQLYLGRSLAEVDMGEYLRSLTSAVGAMQTGVAFEFEADPISMSLEQAVPLGLIVNELLTNSLKHAFPKGECGTVRIAAKRSRDGAVTITVADDGVGIQSADGQPRPRTLGHRLIERLSAQARARVTVESGPGTKHSIVVLPQTLETALVTTPFPVPGHRRAVDRR
jgi:PAS domain S-box-containing protein